MKCFPLELMRCCCERLLHISRHGPQADLVAAMAVNRIGCTSSATLSGDYLAISDTSGALAMYRGALAVPRAAFAVPRAAFAVDGLSMQRCLARPVRGAHKFAEVEAVVVSNFPPAFTSFELPCDRVEALARCVGEQVCLFQASVAEAGHCLLRLEGIDGNSGLIGNSRQDVGASGCGSCVRKSDSEHKKGCRNN